MRDVSLFKLMEYRGSLQTLSSNRAEGEELLKSQPKFILYYRMYSKAENEDIRRNSL